MFNEYSQKGCIFECRLQNTYNHVSCIPWDYPIPPSVNEKYVEICNSSYNSSSMETNADSKLAAFEKYMNSKESIENCSCLPDCEQQVFEAQVTCRDHLSVERCLATNRFCFRSIQYLLTQMTYVIEYQAGIQLSEQCITGKILGALWSTGQVTSFRSLLPTGCLLKSR